MLMLSLFQKGLCLVNDLLLHATVKKCMIMKKILIAATICILCLHGYSKDSTKKKVEKKTEKTSKKVKQKAKKVSKDLDNKTDSVIKKIDPKAHKIK